MKDLYNGKIQNTELSYFINLEKQPYYVAQSTFTRGKLPISAFWENVTISSVLSEPINSFDTFKQRLIQVV